MEMLTWPNDIVNSACWLVDNNMTVSLSWGQVLLLWFGSFLLPVTVGNNYHYIRTIECFQCQPLNRQITKIQRFI